MESDELVGIEIICTHYNIEPSFIDELSDFGLVELTIFDEQRFLEKQRLNELEKIIHLRYDLDINLEGIETIFHLLQRVQQMQEEMNALKNRLRFFEGL